MDQTPAILKPLWARRPDGGWYIHALKSIRLKPKIGHKADYFAFESALELMTPTPPQDFLSAFGSTDYLLKQSILPVAAWIHGEKKIRIIGTAFVVSASGYLVTASHVVLDPDESGYARLTRQDGQPDRHEGLVFGVILPIHPAMGHKGFQIIPFEQAWYWGEWRMSPMIYETDKLHSLTDVAICKLPDKPDGSAYQALSLSSEPFSVGEGAMAVGYAEMKDVPISYVDGKPQINEFNWELYVSRGNVTALYPDNHRRKEVPTPGPAFDFAARIPGRMSGAPIFGADGAVIRGVVSRSFQDVKHATGCMIGPVMTLEFAGLSLEQRRQSQNEGMSIMKGMGL